MTFVLAMHPKAATQESPEVPAISCEKTAHFLLPLHPFTQHSADAPASEVIREQP